MPDPRPTETTQRLKAEIDASKGGDKVKQDFDLGLSTLGTDDEASGNPPTPQEIALARRGEERDAPRSPPEQSAIATQRGFPAVWMIVAAFVVVLAVILAGVWLGRF